MNSIHHKLSIPEWYAGKIVLVSGATGFMGKVLVEKLLRDCSDIKEIYILVRTKRGVEPQQRRDDYINHRIFENIRNTNKSQLQKIQVVKGDVTEENLGISESDKKKVWENVQIVFHCAANVRFDQQLKSAVNFNTNGALRMLQLAEGIKNLKAFIHVSTSYCQCNEDVVEEKAYNAPQNPNGIMQLSKMLDDEILDLVTPRLLNNLPNTYAYTKALTEELVNSFREKIPVAVGRPSIVTSAWKEPMPGWVEGLNGPTGLMIGAGRGVLRSMHCNKHYNADLMPVDVAINTLIALGWERGNNDTKETIFCNIVASPDNVATWGECLDKGRETLHDYPFNFALWYPDGSIKNNYYHHLFCVIFLHFLPAYLIDFLLFIFRKKPFMVKLQKRISNGLDTLQYYTTRNWNFPDTNMKLLYSKLTEEDRIRFFFDMNLVNWPCYIHDYMIGTRQYASNESLDTLPQARATSKRLYIIDRIASMLFYGLIAWCLWSYLGLITGSIQYTFDSLIFGIQNVFSTRAAH